MIFNTRHVRLLCCPSGGDIPNFFWTVWRCVLNIIIMTGYYVIYAITVSYLVIRSYCLPVGDWFSCHNWHSSVLLCQLSHFTPIYYFWSQFSLQIMRKSSTNEGDSVRFPIELVSQNGGVPEQIVSWFWFGFCWCHILTTHAFSYRFKIKMEASVCQLQVPKAGYVFFPKSNFF